MTAPPALELGETEDPTRLVPGEVGTVDRHARVLGRHAERLDEAADAVAGATTPHWTGGLSGSFERRRDALPPRWRRMASVLESMQGSLTTYAGALGTAQGRAQDAIDLWRRGQEATDRAVREHDAAVREFNARQRTDPDPFATPPVFHDPGDHLRVEAQQVLAEARRTLAAAGDAACREVGRLPGARTDGSTGVTEGWEWEDPFSGKGGGGEREWGDDVWKHDRDFDGVVDSDDPDVGNDGIPDSQQPDRLRDHVSVDLGGVEGKAGWGAEGSVEDDWGDVHVGARGEAMALGVKGHAGASIDSDGLKASAGGQVGSWAEGEATAEYGVAEVGARGEVFAGADAEGSVAIGKTGVHASGEAFAGARAEASVSGDVGGVGGEAGAEGWAGVGVAGDAHVGYEDGEFSLGLSGGVGLGIGGKLSGEITIDVPEVVETLDDAADAVGDFTGGVADKVGDLVPDVDLTPW